ncbi:DUF2017 family protein [Cellulomonas sp. C5510]|uniref:DUF2017 family protein n=1 Tax=Cellulomonas sp. C5510 TaxID=2871170 RepID=UPI001C96750F|nr:DUF2017 family protein [Cellulomonas sp. C5510]QZN86712.1 DUF2017 domain-containing protein [Cellulomonas sp. C5510]
MRAFRREGGDLVAEVDAGEREVLATVVADVAELLGGLPGTRPAGDAGDAGGDRPRGDALGEVHLRLDPLPAPDDPAVHRLLPDASRDDPEVTAEFRRLTEDDLRARKLRRLQELHTALLGPAPAGGTAVRGGRHRAGAVVRVPRDRAPELAATLTDVRLVLGERLGVTDEEASDRLEQEVVHGDPAPGDHAAQARQYLGSVFLALGWWQETLMACLLADLPEPPQHDGAGRD